MTSKARNFSKLLGPGDGDDAAIGGTYFVNGSAYTEYTYVATADQTVFSGADESGNSLAIDSDNFILFLNGVKLLDTDYTVNASSNEITLDSGATADDEIVINVVGGNGDFTALTANLVDVVGTITDSTIDLETGTVFNHTLTADTTFVFANPPASGTAYGFTLKVTQDSTARTITWPASVDWAAATAPTLSTGSGEVDVFVFFTLDAGTTYYGFTSGQAMG